MIFPAALMVVIILAAIAVDLSLARNRQRQVEVAAQAAANDAVTIGLDLDRLRSDGSVRLEPNLVGNAVAESLQAQGLDPDARWSWRLDDDRTVTVTIETDVSYVYGRALRRSTAEVTVTGVGTAEAVLP